MSRRDGNSLLNKIIWLFSLGLIGLSLAYFLHRYPITLPAPVEPQTSAEFTLQTDGASSVVVVDTAVIRSAWAKRHFPDADFSLQWVNTIEQEVGGCDIVQIQDFQSAVSNKYKLIVLTESLRSHFEKLNLDSLTTSKGIVIVACQDSVTTISGRSHGAGTVIYVPTHFTRDIVSIQQGRPNDDLTVSNRYTENGQSDKLESNDLISDSRFLDNFTPTADSLEKRLFGVIDSLTILVRWSTAPAGYNGIFVMTHDDEGMGDKGGWMTRYEAANDLRSTTFMMYSEELSSHYVSQIDSVGSSVGLHWNRFDRLDKGCYDTLGIWKWKPVKRKRSLAQQKEWLSLRSDGVRHNRNHYFLWDETYTGTFKALNAAGFTWDMSYGPDLNSKGYNFGTSFPFRPLDDNGALFELYELPATWTENFAGADSNWVDGILNDNSMTYHGVITPLYHNTTYQWRPEMDIYRNWRRSYKMAKATGHAIWTTEDLERFIKLRRNAQVMWTVTAGEVQLVCEAGGDSLALLIPANLVGQPRLETSGSDGAERLKQFRVDQINTISGRMWRVQVPPGQSVVTCALLENALKRP